MFRSIWYLSVVALATVVTFESRAAVSAGPGDVSSPVAPSSFGSGEVARPIAPVNNNGAPLTNADISDYAGEDRIDIFAGDQETYDSNLFRLPSGSIDLATLVLPGATRADEINSAYLVGGLQWTLGRQYFVLNLRGSENRFAHNATLNNFATTGAGVWNWRVGSLFSGQVGVDYSHALAAFSATRYFGRDMVDVGEYFGTFRVDLGPRWSIVGGARELDTSHDAVAALSNNFHSKSANLGLEFATSSNNVFGAEYRYTDGRYPVLSEVAGTPFNRDYEESKASFTSQIAISDKSLVNASVGYLRRSYPYETIGAFSGVVWRASWQWQASEKTQIVFGALRELQAYLDSQSDYFISRTFSISPTWLASEKFKLIGALSWSDQSYITDSPSVLSLGSRHDRVNSEHLDLEYEPLRALTLGFTVGIEQRDSNQALFSYNDKLAKVNLMFKFK